MIAYESHPCFSLFLAALAWPRGRYRRVGCRLSHAGTMHPTVFWQLPAFGRSLASVTARGFRNNANRRLAVARPRWPRAKNRCVF